MHTRIFGIRIYSMIGGLALAAVLILAFDCVANARLLYGMLDSKGDVILPFECDGDGKKLGEWVRKNDRFDSSGLKSG